MSSWRPSPLEPGADVAEAVAGVSEPELESLCYEAGKRRRVWNTEAGR